MACGFSKGQSTETYIYTKYVVLKIYGEAVIRYKMSMKAPWGSDNDTPSYSVGMTWMHCLAQHQSYSELMQ